MIPDVRLIDANAIVEKLKSYYEALSPDVQSELIRRDEVSSCIAELINAPTIDAQPEKHGKWEWEPGYVGTTAKCSVCGLSPIGFYSLPIIQIGRLPEYKFCPNCGADMRGDDADS